MGNVFKFLTAGLLAALVHSPASAVTVVNFKSDAYFSNVTNCTGASPGCSISTDKNVLKMSGATSPGHQPSTLTITDITSPDITTSQSYVLGSITWVNLATYNTDQDFNVKYWFSLAFSKPDDVTDVQMFKLEISQPTNPTADFIFDISNKTLKNLGPFEFDGVTISNIHFEEVGDGDYNGKTWMNPEGKTSTLNIVADFKFDAVAPVPEPSTWAMMILGFAGVGFMAYRRKRGGNALTAA